MQTTVFNLSQCPDKPEVEVTYTRTVVPVSGDTPGIDTIEIDEVNCKGDILSILAWYDYNSLTNELISKIQN
jgi:hypothetical protein